MPFPEAVLLELSASWGLLHSVSGTSLEVAHSYQGLLIPIRARRLGGAYGFLGFLSISKPSRLHMTPHAFLLLPFPFWRDTHIFIHFLRALDAFGRAHVIRTYTQYMSNA